VRSQVGAGATFTVLLPIEADVFASYTDLRKGPPPPPEVALRPPLSMPSLEPVDGEETPGPLRQVGDERATK
jgi:hypothetical protein